MSKVKKRPASLQTSISEIDIKFEKIIQITGFLFLLACLGALGLLGLLDLANIIETDVSLNAMSFAFILFSGTSSGLTFGMGLVIKNNRDKKRRYFLDWLFGEFFLCMMAIFSVAIYQW
ncbi:MAG: hypothetical protein ACFFBP_16715 [Promethearchaeota archaeon]